MRRLAITLCLLLVSASAIAGGVRVKKWLDLPELVKGSKVILRGKVLKLDHVYNSRRAYGRRVTYMATFRVLLGVDQVVRGGLDLRHKRVWLVMRVYGRPGAWAIVPRAYRTGLYPGAVKPGTRLIAFTLKDQGGLSTQGKQTYLDVFAIEQEGKLKQVLELIRTPKAK